MTTRIAKGSRFRAPNGLLLVVSSVAQGIVSYVECHPDEVVLQRETSLVGWESEVALGELVPVE